MDVLRELISLVELYDGLLINDVKLQILSVIKSLEPRASTATDDEIMLSFEKASMTGPGFFEVYPSINSIAKLVDILKTYDGSLTEQQKNDAMRVVESLHPAVRRGRLVRGSTAS